MIDAFENKEIIQSKFNRPITQSLLSKLNYNANYLFAVC